MSFKVDKDLVAYTKAILPPEVIEKAGGVEVKDAPAESETILGFPRANREESQKDVDFIVPVMEAIRNANSAFYDALAKSPSKDKNPQGVAGSIDCPACKTGQISYTISGYNGHVMGSCSTKTCYPWFHVNTR